MSLWDDYNLEYVFKSYIKLGHIYTHKTDENRLYFSLTDLIAISGNLQFTKHCVEHTYLPSIYMTHYFVQDITNTNV